MIKTPVLSLFLFVFSTILSQNHVQWDFNFNSLESEVIVSAEIENGWHLYSLKTPPNSGPLPTSFFIEKNKNIRIKKKFYEILEPEEKFDVNFGSIVYIFEKKYESRAKVRIKKNKNSTFQGSINYMVCNESQCLPPIEKKFKIEIK